MQENETPRVWIGSLAAYNNGRLVGEWCDADDLATLEECVTRVLKKGGGEEFALMDREGFGDVIGEYTQLERVAEIAGAIMEHGEAFRFYCESEPTWAESEEVSELVETFESAYCGQWDGALMGEPLREYAEENWPELMAEHLSDEVLSYIDWDKVTRTYEHDGYWERDGHVFQPV
ncbi:MAG: antirestriction protein ArdA [Actinobacteria bacterium]|nr:antirestriction protein ArdA [Actinomycetota bacterium]